MCPVVVVPLFIVLFPDFNGVPLFIVLFLDFDDTITWDAHETYIIYYSSMESMC
jgi:hypothetical protein